MMPTTATVPPTRGAAQLRATPGTGSLALPRPRRTAAMLAAALAALACTASVATADNARLLKLISILRDNGTITQEQYEQLVAAADDTPARQPVPTRSPPATDVMVKTEGGIEISTYDGRFSGKIGGQIMLDAAHYEEDRNKEALGDGTEFRSLRLELGGRLAGDWEYEMEVDFSDNDTDVDNAFVRYAALEPTTLTLGQFKEPFSLEEQTNRKFLTFMERSLANELVPRRSIGLGAASHGDAWTGAIGLFGEDVNDDPEDEGDEGWGVTSRVTVAPVHGERRVLHLGASLSYRELDDARELRFRTGPESHITERTYLDTGKIKKSDGIDDVDGLLRYGLEAAAVLGPFSVQGEYIAADVEREPGEDNDDVSFNGWYVFGSCFLTGESRNYGKEAGRFGRITPRSKYGALELGVRYSRLDLTDGPIAGGEGSNITLGLNWYINERLRLMANYAWTDNDEEADENGEVAGRDEPRIFQVRFQADF